MADEQAPPFTPQQLQIIQTLAQQQQPQPAFNPYPGSLTGATPQPRAAAQPQGAKTQAQQDQDEEQAAAPNPAGQHVSATATGEVPISTRRGHLIIPDIPAALAQYRSPPVNPVPVETLMQMRGQPNPQLSAAQMRLLQAIAPPSQVAKPVLGIPATR